MTYLFSALSIRSLSGYYPDKWAPVTPRVRKAPWMHLIESYHWMRSDPALFRGFVFKSVCGGIWGAVYLIGFALLAHGFESRGFGAYAWMTASYGVGNILSALVFGNYERRVSEVWIYAGFLLIGGSFIGMAYSDSLLELCFFSALGAAGGPMNDLPFLEMLQGRFSPERLNRLIRLRMISETIFYLVFTLLSPFLFRSLGIAPSIAGAGYLCVVLSVVFYLRSRSLP